MNRTDGELDIVTIGRASVDLYGQQIGTRLEDVASFAKSVGGCPTNIAVGTARLGLRLCVPGRSRRGHRAFRPRLRAGRGARAPGSLHRGPGSAAPARGTPSPSLR